VKEHCPNAFSFERYGVSSAHATMSIFAKIFSICATPVPFACAALLWAIAEIPCFSQSWRVALAHSLCAI
jgi:DNA topoisomerase VI subunit B